jgi:PAS domain S-box-containing protein
MANPLKLLLVEDSAQDAELIVHELCKEGLEVEHERVCTAPAMSDALNRQEWDAIIADYALPGFSGPAALELYKHHGLDIPFLCVSGKIGEEEAVEMMRAGAHDYVMKLNLHRLASAVKREIASAGQRAELRRQQLAKGYLAAIVEHSHDAIIGKNLNGIIVSWNRAAEAMYGYTAEEVVGRPVSVIMPPGCEEELAGMMEKIRVGERIENYETFRMRKDGSFVDVSVTVSPVRGTLGQVTGASIIVRDITASRRRENDLADLNARLQESLDHIKTLSGLLPICANCKKIRNDQGYWEQVETYIKQHSDAEFTHGLCPDCLKELYPEYVHTPN